MWKSICCEVQGSGHKKHGIPCQDKAYTLEKSGVHVIALADGAGSAAYSHFGATCVVTLVSELLTSNFYTYWQCDDGRQVKNDLILALRQALENEAERQGCFVNDLASTLLAVAVDGERYIVIHIGDGVIGYLDGDVLKVASAPDNGEFSNETIFVTSNDAIASMRLYKGTLNDKCAFILMSDGSGRSLYHNKSKHLASVTKKLMHRTCLLEHDAMERQLHEALETVIAKNTQDDVSLAILAQPSKALPVFEDMTDEERRVLYQIDKHDGKLKKRMSRYDDVMQLLCQPHSLKQIATVLGLKEKYANKYLNRLMDIGLVQKEKGLFFRHDVHIDKSKDDMDV